MVFFMEETFGNFFHHTFHTWPGKILAQHSIRHVQFANRNRTLRTNTSVKLCLLTKMPMRTIFFRKPNLSPQQLFLLAVAIVLFVGYTLLEKKSLRADSLVHAEHHQVTSKVIFTSETKSQLSEPSLTYGEKDFFLQGKPLRILSGAVHYFRVVPQYWKDRLVKLKAMGLNTVET